MSPLDPARKLFQDADDESDLEDHSEYFWQDMARLYLIGGLEHVLFFRIIIPTD